MNIKYLIETAPLYSQIKQHFRFAEELAPYTSFKIGGKAEALYLPESITELQTMFKFFIEQKIEFSIIGNASNLLISDDGIKGVVIRISNFTIPSIIKQENDDVFVAVGAGTLIEDFLKFCIQHELSGLEDFGGLPASIGGAVFMNAKCFETSISDVLISAEVMKISKYDATLSEYKMQKNEWSYKCSPFQKCALGIHVQEGREIVLSCLFKLKKGKLVSDAGLLGLQCGAAQVAQWHGNFIINRGGASAKDVLQLMEKIRKKIQEKHGILLESEIIYCQ